MVLYTIGHSNHIFEKFLALLNENNIHFLVDVRTAPFSRYHHQFNKDELQNKLHTTDIEYVFAGQYLGGRPKDPSCYRHHEVLEESADYLHEVNYREVMKRDWFQKGVKRLLELASTDVTAIMCAEENPAECHRHHLISVFIMENYPEFDVRHIRGDGTIFGAGSIRISLESTNVDQPSLFE